MIIDEIIDKTKALEEWNAIWPAGGDSPKLDMGYIYNEADLFGFNYICNAYRDTIRQFDKSLIVKALEKYIDENDYDSKWKKNLSALVEVKLFGKAIA